jgi:dienelactone hydrolase
MTTLEPAEDVDGVTEERFRLSVNGETVPGLIWRPSGAAAAGPVILLGHGRTSHKRNPYLLQMARSFARDRRWAAVALDAAGHGDRRQPDAGPEQGWPRPDQSQAVAEWRTCIEFLGSADIETGVLGYWGVSMGAALGISLIAAEPAIRAAVLGLMHPRWPAPPGQRIRADAARLTCPVLFLVNWDDSRVPRAQAFELFELIGSPDKRLLAYPGDHGQLPDEAMTVSADFFARQLDPH